MDAATAADERGYGCWRTCGGSGGQTRAQRRQRGGEGRQPLGAADGGASAGEAAHDGDCSGGGLAAAGWPPGKVNLKRNSGKRSLTGRPWWLGKE
ncbi:hypothetical protein SESBI_43874 [Sesbania bispinosa]|nr:hypothetical protein SESBI_43874 [Sesbania bispinosa]